MSRLRESGATLVALVVGGDANGVDGYLGLAGKLNHLLVGDDRRGVLAVRKQDDRLPPHRGARLLLLLKILDGNIEGIVQRG